jgi:hypothetical protein
MRLELIPLIVGVVVALLGVGILFDAWTPDEMMIHPERRRRPRVERHRAGEALIGLGVLGLAGAFIGSDSWRYSTLTVIIGVLFLVVGTFLNFAYVRELFTNRGPLRRRETQDAPDFEVAVPPAVRTVADRAPTEVPPPSRSSDAAPSSYSGAERRKQPRGERKRF